MKHVLLLLVLAVFLAGCATATPVEYKPHPFTPPTKAEEYQLPPDPFAGTSAPAPIFLKKGTDGKYALCSKEEAEVVAFTAKDLDKITLRISYLKDINAKLVDLVNVQIRRGNVLVDIVVDMNTSKEIIRQIVVDLQNQIEHNKKWMSVKEAGYWAIIIGQLAAILAVAL